MEELDQQFAPALDRARELAGDFLATLPERPVWPSAGYDEILAAVGGPLPEHGRPAEEVVSRLAAAVGPGLAGSPSGRFFGFVVGGTHPAALAADWLTATWDQNAGITSLTPAAAAVEEVSRQWVLDLLHLPEESLVGFVTGGQMANYTCLAAARHAVLERAGWDVNRRGLSGGPRVVVVAGEHRHHTVDLAVRYLGLGAEALVTVPSDDQGRIRPDALEDALDRHAGAPVVVCLQAGEVHTGAFDPFPAAIAAARRHGAWVHVDGAFGLWAAAGTTTAHLVDGMAAADSWSTDAHKTLNVPYDSGLALVRDGRHLTASFGITADYLLGGAMDPLERTPEFSRRARGFPVWAVLTALGRSGVAALVDRLAARAALLAEGLRGLPGVEVLNDVVFTQVMVSFGDDERTSQVGRRVLADGTAVITPAEWRGRVVQRCSMSNWSTSERDVERTLEALRGILATL